MFILLLSVVSLLSGCAAAAVIPTVGSAEVIPVIGASYQGYVVWKGRESSRYYTYDVKTICQAIERSCDQLKIEKMVQKPAPESGCSLQTKGKNPMEINALTAEKNLTKVTIAIELFGDKEYAELLYRTIDENSRKTIEIRPISTDAVIKTETPAVPKAEPSDK